MSSTLVSIIFCHHVGDFIFPAVESAFKQRGVTFEIIVATSIPDLVIPGVDRVLHVPGMPALKRNVASRYARGQYLAFYDDDTTLDIDSVREQWKVCARPEIGMTFGKLLKMDDPTMLDEAGGYLTFPGFIWSRAGRSKDRGQFNKVEPIFAAKSAACMIRKRLFIEIGGFDTEFGILGEESDLAWRVWSRGKRVYYVPKSRTLHAFGTKLKPVAEHYTDRRVFYNGPRNYLLMHIKNAPVHRLVPTVILQLGAWTVAALGQLIAGRPRACLLILEGLLYPFLHLGDVLKKRQRTQAIAQVPWTKIKTSIYRSIHPSYFFLRLVDYIRTGIHG